MAKQHLVLLALLASIFHTVSSSNSTVDGTPATAYDILEQNKLPRGLLPLGVKSYILHKGAMEVKLPGLCDFFVTVAGRKYKIRYDSADGGVIQSGSITQVYGVRVQGPYGLWLGFDQVYRAGDQLKIRFSDGYETYTRSFPVSSFTQSPRCNEGSV